MATTETITVELADGGTITLTIEADFLAMCIEDFSLVKELVELVRNVGGTSSPQPPKPAPAVKAAKPKKAASPPRASAYDRAEVARLANAAVRAGESMKAAVALGLGISEAAAAKQIKVARLHGYHITAGRAGRKPQVAKPSNVTPLPPVAEIEIDNHPAAGHRGPTAGARAFTPDDTLRIIEGG